jgi:cyclopropane fatty-acyl-phospholipid synthase-like methyltransferase
MSRIYQLLEFRPVYNFVQRLARIGGAHQLHALFHEFADSHPYDAVLELGCGTGLWTVSNVKRYVRTDINQAYFPANPPPGMEFRTSDAADLSAFPDESFDLVYSMGLYHHLPDDAVISSLQESSRVLRKDGKIIVFDAILPTNRLNFPAWILRKLDRGGWVRREAGTAALCERAGLNIRRRKRCRWGPGLEGCAYEAVPGVVTGEAAFSGSHPIDVKRA